MDDEEGRKVQISGTSHGESKDDQQVEEKDDGEE